MTVMVLNQNISKRRKMNGPTRRRYADGQNATRRNDDGQNVVGLTPMPKTLLVKIPTVRKARIKMTLNNDPFTGSTSTISILYQPK